MLPLPELTPENTAFWTGGERGELMIVFCNACSQPVHVPQVICPHCLSRDVEPRAVAGTGTVYTFTINHQPWMPDMKVPFALAVVDLDGAPGARVTAMVEHCDPEAVHIGQRVRAGFTQNGEVWLPHWLPLDEENGR